MWISLKEGSEYQLEYIHAMVITSDGQTVLQSIGSDFGGAL